LFGHEACIDFSQSPVADVTVAADEPLVSLPLRAEGSTMLATTANDSIMDDLLCFFGAPPPAETGDTMTTPNAASEDAVSSLDVTATQVQLDFLRAEAAALTPRRSEDATCANDAKKYFSPQPSILAHAQASLQSRDVGQIREAMASILGLLERLDDQPGSQQLEEVTREMLPALHIAAMELAAVLGWLPE
jgi:hypothetical protein